MYLDGFIRKFLHFDGLQLDELRYHRSASIEVEIPAPEETRENFCHKEDQVKVDLVTILGEEVFLL